jgi:hypothetical protein
MSAVDRFVAMLARGLRLKSEHEQYRILKAGRELLANRRALQGKGRGTR